MEFKAYKLSYYLNAQHSLDHLKSSIHSHTFYVSMYIEDITKKGLINFQNVEQIIKHYFNQYSGKYLNEITPFDQLRPTIENLGAVFYEDLKVLLAEQGHDLIQIDISENPLRVYSISDRLYLGSQHKD